MGYSISKSGEKCWRVRYDDPVTPRRPDGKRNQNSFSWKGTKASAKAEVERILTEMRELRYIEPVKESVADYLEDWFASYREKGRAANTLLIYRQQMDLHILPRIGAIPLQSLDEEHLDRLYTELRRERHLSEKTLSLIHTILKQALDRAERFRKILRNPARWVDKPSAPRPNPKPMTAEQVDRLLEAAASTRIYLPVLLGAYTGMRRGEILGLRWQDVDLDKGLIHVRQQAVGYRRDDLAFADLKTDSSKGTVTLVPEVVAALVRQKGHQAERRLQSARYLPSDLVCTHDDGKPFVPKAFTDEFKRLLVKIGLGQFSFHALRHTHATLLAEDGVPINAVRDRLRHASSKTTLDFYAKTTPKMADAAAETFARRLRKVL